MWRCEEEKIWGWEMWRCEDEKMKGWEEKMWRGEDVRMRKCEDEKMWRWEDVRMRRCDEKMRRWEDEIQTPTIGRTLRSDALGKNIRKNTSQKKLKNTKFELQGLENGFALILQAGSCFSKWTWGWLPGSFLNLYFVCILYFRIFGFVFFLLCIFVFLLVFFLHFVFLSNCMRIYFVFFVITLYFCRKNEINANNTLCIFVFFWYFSITSKNALCIFVFFCIFPFLHRLHFVLLYFSFFRHAVKEQNGEFTNVCCISILLAISPAAWLLFLYLVFGDCIFCTFFLCFSMITGSTWLLNTSSHTLHSKTV